LLRCVRRQADRLSGQLHELAASGTRSFPSLKPSLFPIFIKLTKLCLLIFVISVERRRCRLPGVVLSNILVCDDDPREGSQ